MVSGVMLRQYSLGKYFEAPVLGSCICTHKVINVQQINSTLSFHTETIVFAKIIVFHGLGEGSNQNAISVTTTANVAELAPSLTSDMIFDFCWVRCLQLVGLGRVVREVR
jgi:hypothetical protein